MSQPDFVYLMKLDSWSKKDASLIISGLNPDEYRKIRFIPKDLDFNLHPELTEPYKLYKLFLSIDFYQYRNNIDHPLTYICECLKKEWKVPEELIALAKSRYWRETGRKLTLNGEDEKNDCAEEQIQGKKEKSYLLKSLALMTMLYVSKQNSQRLGKMKNINVSQVTEDILQFMEDNELNIYGVGKSSLNKRIAEGLRLLGCDKIDWEP